MRVINNLNRSRASFVFSVRNAFDLEFLLLPPQAKGIKEWDGGEGVKWKKNSHFLFGQRDAQSRTTDWRERHNLTHKAHTAPVSEVDNKHENNICYGASLFLLTYTHTHTHRHMYERVSL